MHKCVLDLFTRVQVPTEVRGTKFSGVTGSCKPQCGAGNITWVILHLSTYLSI